MNNIAIFTASEGHYSIATAIKEKLQSAYNVDIFQDIDQAFDLYNPIYRFFPGMMTIPFELTKGEWAQKQLEKWHAFKYNSKILNFYQAHKPVLTISTYFMFNPALRQIKKDLHVPFINILTDPWSIHPILISSAASINVGFDAKSIEAVKILNHSAQIQAMGWFVRNKYEEHYQQNQVRQQLSLNLNTFTMLVVSGSEGTNMILKILPMIRNTPHHVQVVVACGHNKTLYKSVQAASNLLSNSKNVSLIPLPFIDNLHQYMQAADLVIGKAGPNTIFESAATHTPFFATTHISGQETGNLDLIKHYQLGYVEENSVKAGHLLQQIIAQPQELMSFQQPLQKMATYNRQAKLHLLDSIASLVT